MEVKISVNGKLIKREIGADLMLIDFLRANGYTSVKRGCETSNCGLCTVHLNGKNKMHHRIIAECFIPNPDNKPEVNHKNGIRNDNRIENLEWCTRAENVQHSFKELGRKSNLIGNKGKRKYPTEKIIEELKNKIDYSILKEKYGVTSNYLSNLIHINNLERYMKN